MKTAVRDELRSNQTALKIFDFLEEAKHLQHTPTADVLKEMVHVQSSVDMTKILFNTWHQST